jgi:hypothetical protein
MGAVLDWVGAARVSWDCCDCGVPEAPLTPVKVVSEPKRTNSGKSEAKANLCMPSGFSGGKMLAALGSGLTVARRRSLSFALAARKRVL